VELDPRILAAILLRGVGNLAEFPRERTPSALLGWVVAAKDLLYFAENEFRSFLLDANVEPLKGSV
jgi:hypothetical protein